MSAMFAIHSTARARHTRTVRAQAPSHKGLTQFLGGELRLVRGRPLMITEDRLRAHLAEVTTRVTQGLLEVRTPDGRLVDLATFVTESPAVTPPQPTFPLDSIARDKPWGQRIDPLPGDSAILPDPDKVPALLSQDDDEEEEDDPLPSQPPPKATEAQPWRRGERRRR